MDEPDEGEKLRASARPPDPATRVALSRVPAAYSRPGRAAAAPRRVHVQERVPAPGAAALHDRGPQQELARPRRGVRQGGLRGIAVCSSSRGKKGKARAEGRERARHAAWREAVRFVAVSHGAILRMAPAPSSTPFPMRDDMGMETWAMRISVAGSRTQAWLARPCRWARRLELEVPRRVRRCCCQRFAAGGPQHQTQVHSSAPHPRPARRVGHSCANGADEPPRS